MAQTPSTFEMKPGDAAPGFRLSTADEQWVELHDFQGQNGALVMFICNHCPFVIHVRDELARLGRDYSPEAVSIVAINSNDVTAQPADSPEKMKEEAAASGYEFPYVFDESQEIAKAYRAACTPDFFFTAC